MDIFLFKLARAYRFRKLIVVPQKCTVTKKIRKAMHHFTLGPQVGTIKINVFENNIKAVFRNVSLMA